MNLQIINCTGVSLVEFQKPPGEMRVGCEAQPSSETFKIVICSGDCDLCWDSREPRAPFPLTSSWWADAPASEWPTEVMKGVSKNTPGVCEAVLFSQWTHADFSTEILWTWRWLAVEILCYKRSMREPCLALQGEQGDTEGPGNRNLSRGKGEGGNCESNPAVFVLICFLKCEGVVMLEINGKTGGGEGKQVVHGTCRQQLPQHTCSEKPTWAFLRGLWLLQHPSVVAHRAIKVMFELFPGSQLCH